jgi:hypothetical protein
MCERLHRAHDVGHSFHTGERTLERRGQRLARVVEIRVVFGLGELLNPFGTEHRLDRLHGGLVAVEEPDQINQRAAGIVQVVPDELHGRIDLVRHAGSELPNCPEVLCLGQPSLELALFGHVSNDTYRFVVAAANDAHFMVQRGTFGRAARDLHGHDALRCAAEIPVDDAVRRRAEQELEHFGLRGERGGARGASTSRLLPRI